MKLKHPTIALTTGMIISTSVQAYADDEVTIRMMEIDESTQDAVTKVIPLPEKSKHLKLEQQKASTTQKNGESKTEPEKMTEQEQLRIREIEMEQEMIREAQEQRIEAEIQHNEQTQEQENSSETIKNMNPNQ